MVNCPKEIFEDLKAFLEGNERTYGKDRKQRFIGWSITNSALAYRADTVPDDYSHQMEDALFIQKNKLQDYLDMAGVIILTIGRDHKVSLINKKGCEVLGYSKNEIIGKDWFDHFIPENMRDEVKITFEKILKGEIKPFEYFENPVLTKQGNERFIAWHNTVLTDKKGRTIGTLSSGEDITTRKLAEEALKESEQKYRSFVEDDLTGDYISTPEGKILFCNPAFLRIFGFTFVEEALNFNAKLLYPTIQDMENFLTHLKQKRKLENYEMQLRTRHGRPLNIIANVIGNFDEQGELVKIKGYIYDITEYKKLEEQFRQAQKLEAVGRLAGGVAHDFNNLLSVIDGYSQMLLEGLPRDNSLRKNVEMIRKAGERAESLIGQLLAFSRKQVLQLCILNLNKLVTNLEKMLGRVIGEDIDLVTIKDPDLKNIKADPNQMEQVLMNLAVNARDAMPNGGKLIIETQNVELDEDYMQQHPVVKAGSYVMLAMSDTGTGMNAEIKSNIFEPFFTTKEEAKGTGLGLSTVYGIVKQSDGYIWVYSEPGKGSTFKIYLPQVKEAAAEEIPVKPKAKSLQGSETILLVEDDDQVRDVGEMILSNYGYKVLKAQNGEEAIKISEQYKSAIQLVITDVVLPGISGKNLADQMAASQPEMKVLYVSGYTGDAIVRHGILDAGVFFLSKPFGPEKLLQKVRDVLDEGTNGN